MKVYPGTQLQTQIVATICDRALGWPVSPQGWDGSPLNTLVRCDSVPTQYAGTTRQQEQIWFLSSADCWYPMTDATAAAVAASSVISAGDKATVAAAAAARITVADPTAGGRVPQTHYIGGLVYWLGDSLTQLAGMRYYLKQFQLAHHYVTNQVGIYDVPGGFSDFLDNKTSGQGGDTCAVMTARCTSELAAWPLTRLACLMAGSNDAFIGTPASPNYGTLLDTLFAALSSAQPTARIAVTTIPPRSDVDVSSYNAALPAIWDAFDAAHPGNLLIRWNANAALGGVYNPAYYDDNVHLNNVGYAKIVQDPTPGVGMAVTLQSYLSQIGAWP